MLLAPGKDEHVHRRDAGAGNAGHAVADRIQAMVADLVNYLDYMAEPAKNKRISLGLVVLLYFVVLFVFAYWLKREYWKDVH